MHTHCLTSLPLLLMPRGLLLLLLLHWQCWQQQRPQLTNCSCTSLS
jgi:hypothetical protein